MALLEVSDLRKISKDEEVLKGISFEQVAGQRIAIAGETGSGKSTLLRIIAGLVQPDGGQVLLDGVRVKGPDEQLLPGHKQIAYLSQHFELRHSYRVEEVLEMASQLTDAAANAIYEVCDIRHLLQRKTTRLSGGERQRVAMARLLVTSPKLFLLDEPFSNLDRPHKQTIQAVIREIGDRLGITCIIVSHDPLDLLPWADQILVLREGRAVQQGSPEHIYRRPVSEYVASMFGSYNLLTMDQAAAFSAAQGLEVSARPVMVRPEDIRINSTQSSGVPGTVVARRFFGSYCEAEVLVAGNRMTVSVGGSEAAPGARVSLSVIPERISYL